MPTPSKYLSKTDFKVAQTCPTKLFYKKHSYPTSLDENEYMKMLADGGYMVGLMAQLLYPDGIEITGSTAEAIAATEKYLLQDDVTLFEPAIEINGKLIRIDILQKIGNSFSLIEVKSKSFDSVKWQEAKSKGKKYWEKPAFQPYLEDVAFQKFVLQEKFPDANINGFLLCPDKSKTTQIEGMIGWFAIKENETKTKGFRKTIVEFLGSKDDLEAMRKDHILGLVNVDEWIDPMIPNIAIVSEKYIQSIQMDERIIAQINYKCRDCEYSTTDPEHLESGFKVCWGKLAEPKPHILELAYLGNVNRRKEFKDGINQLIVQGKTNLFDIPLDKVTNDDGKPYYNNRPLYQLTEKKEFILDEFWDEIRNLEYPLHFIDFETSTMAIPYHAGMHPYENVIFQWSCHTIEKEGDEPIHSEWLNTIDVYPNVEFAQALKKQLGTTGTFLTWSKYENTQLKTISHSLDESDGDEAALLSWIKEVAEMEKEERTSLLDMNMLALKYYFHPLMKGKTSIKITLPAVLQAYKSERITNWLRKDGLYKKREDGSIVNPYELLPEPTPIYEGKRIKVQDGSGAMMAYQDMLYFGLSKNDEAVKKQYIDGLLKYCKLDTLAMVIIWEHWMSLRK